MAREFTDLWSTYLLYLSVDLGRATVTLDAFSCVSGELSLWRIDFLDVQQFGLFYEEPAAFDRTELSEFYRKPVVDGHQVNVVVWNGISEMSLVCGDFRCFRVSNIDCSEEYERLRDQFETQNGELIKGESALIAGDVIAHRYFPFSKEYERRKQRWAGPLGSLQQPVDSVEIDVSGKRVALEKRRLDQSFIGYEERISAVGLAWGAEASWARFFLGELYDEDFCEKGEIRAAAGPVDILMSKGPH